MFSALNICPVELLIAHGKINNSLDKWNYSGDSARYNIQNNLDDSLVDVTHIKFIGTKSSE